MKTFIIVIILAAIAIGVLLNFSSQEKEPKPPIDAKTNSKTSEPTNTKPPVQKMPKIKELTFVDDKGAPLFGGKKLLLIAGQVELEKGIVFQLVTDDNGRWKLELTAKDYAIAENNPLFEEGNLYPINAETLKDLNTIVLTKVQN